MAVRCAAAVAFALTVAAQKPLQQLNTQCLMFNGLGCSSIQTENECLNSRDGRFFEKINGRRIRGEPCVWCNGDNCPTSDGSKGNLCEAYEMVYTNPAVLPPAMAAVANCNDYRSIEDTISRVQGVTEFTAQKSVFYPVGGGDDKVCRGISAYDDGKGVMTVAGEEWSYAIWTADSFEQCKALCAADCVAVEYKEADKYCETWVDMVQNSGDASGYKCYSKKTSCLKPAHSGCRAVKDKATCLDSKDGREHMPFADGEVGVYQSPCSWCDGGACTDGSDAQCETLSVLIHGHGKAYNKFLGWNNYEIATCEEGIGHGVGATVPASEWMKASSLGLPIVGTGSAVGISSALGESPDTTGDAASSAAGAANEATSAATTVAGTDLEAPLAATGTAPEFSGTAADKASALQDVVGDAVSSTLGAAGDATDATGAATAAAGAATDATSAASDASPVATDVALAVAGAATGVASDAAGTATDAAGDAVSSAIDTASAPVDTATAAASAATGEATDAVGDAAPTVTDAVGDATSAATDSAIAAAGAATDGTSVAVGAATDAVGIATDKALTLPGVAATPVVAAGDASSGATDAATAAAGTATDAASATPGAATDAVVDATSAATDAASADAGAATGAAPASAGAATDAAVGATSAATDAATAAAGTANGAASAATVAATDAASDPTSAATVAASAASGAAAGDTTSATSDAATAAAGAATDAGSAATDAATDAAATAPDAATAAAGAATDAGSAATDAATAAAATAPDAATAAAGAATDAASAAAGAATDAASDADAAASDATTAASAAVGTGKDAASAATGSTADAAAVGVSRAFPTFAPVGGKFVRAAGTNDIVENIFWVDALGKHPLPAFVNCDECGCSENVEEVAVEELGGYPMAAVFTCMPSAPPAIVDDRFMTEGRFISAKSGTGASPANTPTTEEGSGVDSIEEGQVYFQDTAGILHPVSTEEKCTCCTEAKKVDAGKILDYAKGPQFNCDMLGTVVAGLPTATAAAGTTATAGAPVVSAGAPEITTSGKSGGGFSLGAGAIAGGVLAIAVLGGAAWYVIGGKKNKKKKGRSGSKRGVQGHHWHKDEAEPILSNQDDLEAVSSKSQGSASVAPAPVATAPLYPVAMHQAAGTATAHQVRQVATAPLYPVAMHQAAGTVTVHQVATGHARVVSPQVLQVAQQPTYLVAAPAAEPSAASVFDQIDRDHDGVLTREEWDKYAFRAFDANHDGQVSVEEFRASGCGQGQLPQ